VKSFVNLRDGSAWSGGGRLRQLAVAAPALFMLALAAAVFLGTSELRIWRGVTPGPRFFPLILAGSGALLAVLLLIAQWRGAEAAVLDLPDRYGAIQVGATVAVLAGFGLLVPLMGMVLAAGLFTLVMLLAVQRQRLLPSLVAAVIVALGMQLVFVQWLKVALPAPAFL
jgi:hypothetical protein